MKNKLNIFSNNKIKSFLTKLLFKYELTFLKIEEIDHKEDSTKANIIIINNHKDYDKINFEKLNSNYLILLNLISIFLGLPFSIIFDFMLIKLFGYNYVLFFSPFLAILSVIQVFILRKINFKFSRSIYFYKKLANNYFLIKKDPCGHVPSLELTF